MTTIVGANAALTYKSFSVVIIADELPANLVANLITALSVAVEVLSTGQQRLVLTSARQGSFIFEFNLEPCDKTVKQATVMGTLLSAAALLVAIDGSDANSPASVCQAKYALIEMANNDKVSSVNVAADKVAISYPKHNSRPPWMPEGLEATPSLYAPKGVLPVSISFGSADGEVIFGTTISGTFFSKPVPLIKPDDGPPRVISNPQDFKHLRDGIRYFFMVGDSSQTGVNLLRADEIFEGKS